jgi:GNAT superfamily N-acetyltransferase
MNYEIRRLHSCEVAAALDLAMETYLEFEAPDYGPEGVTTFRRDIYDNAAFRAACMSGTNRMWGALDGTRIIGLMAMRGESHIVLVFTHRDYHRQGVASAILQALLADVRRENPSIRRLTLNSSPYGLPFYLHAGFNPADVEKTINGIRFTPMTYDL